DEVELPWRLREVERRAHQVADELLDGGLAAGGGEPGTVDVRAEVEVRIAPPHRCAGEVRDALAEALVDEEALLDEPPELVEVQRGGEAEHADDRHRVDGGLHAEPGYVGGAEFLGAGHEEGEAGTRKLRADRVAPATAARIPAAGASGWLVLRRQSARPPLLKIEKTCWGRRGRGCGETDCYCKRKR